MTVETDNESDVKKAISVQVPVPIDLHRRLRMKAFRNDLSLRAAVIVAIESWVEDEEEVA
jgi:hypothetical protein